MKSSNTYKRIGFFFQESQKAELLPYFWVALLASALFSSNIQALEEAFRFDLPTINSDDIVDLEADHLIYYRAQGKAEATGNVSLEVKGLQLYSEHLFVDLERSVAIATGNVIAEYGSRRLLASRLFIEMDSYYALADHAALIALDPRTNRLIVRLEAERLERTSENLYIANHLCFSACDCQDDRPPSWSFSAARARITPGEGSLLIGSAFRILSVPVFPLPFFYLPLGERRSGFLLPSIGFSGHNGTRLAIPFYLTLGRSWDLTLDSGFYTGTNTWESERPSRPGVRGPEQALELRWATARRTKGILVATHLYDLHTAIPDPEAPRRGSRYSINANHTSQLDRGRFGMAGHGVHARFNLLSDAALAADLKPTLEEVQRGYLRSTARVHASPSERVSLEIGARWLQDTRRTTFVDDDGVRRAHPLFGEKAPGTTQLLPMLYAGTSPLALTQGSSLRSDFRLSSWQKASGPVDDKESLFHFRSTSEISQAFRIGELLSGRALASANGDIWLGSLLDESSTRIYPLLNLSTHTGLERRFSSIAHRITPSITWRLIPYKLGESPQAMSDLEIPALDIYERAFSNTNLHQASFSLSNEAWFEGSRIISATLRQSLNLQDSSISNMDLFISASPIGMRHSIDAMAGWDWDESTISWSTLTGRLLGAAGASMHLRWIWMQPWSGDRLTSGMEELMAAGALPPSFLLATNSEINEAALTLRAPRIRGLSTRYALSVELVENPRPPQQTLAAAYRSKCGCWSTSIAATWPPGRTVPEIALTIELAGIGSAGTRTLSR